MNIAIITGASSGIGEELLKVLIKEHGAYGSVPFEQIWIIARNKDKLEALKSALDPSRIRVFPLDLTDDHSMKHISDTLEKEKPGIGMLINCAGTGYIGLTEHQSSSSVQSVVSLNCNAAARMIEICLPYMITIGDASDYKNGPRILNIASSAGFFPQPGFAIYAATKAFLISLSRALHVELYCHNIASTTVCPGPVATDFIARASGQEKSEFKGIRKLFVVRADKLARKSISASRKGRSILVYGFAQKVLHLMSKLLPTRFLMFLSAKSNGISKKRSVHFVDPKNTSNDSIHQASDSDVSTTFLLPVSSKKSDKKNSIKPSSTKSLGNKTSNTSVDSNSIATTDHEAASSNSLQKVSDTEMPTHLNINDITSDTAAKILAQYPGRKD